ncbi:MAG TPA: TonB-dependent receptor [Gammaproteobacteria bacterium]|nr:TonB-dependent receptor [Gammaproteobacteria bacterium]
MKNGNAAIALLWLFTSNVMAQESGLGVIEIRPNRVGKSTDEIPAAISSVGQSDIQLGMEQLGLDESLRQVPGLFMQNRYNFAQDLRASIRGFGARSNFGIRGIKIIVDGIPETLPDGQGSVDGIDIGSAGQINIIRGPVSSLYGNASGGAILIETERGPAVPFAEIRSSYGDYDFSKQQVKAGGDTGELNYLLNLSDTKTEGYRDHSAYENTQANVRLGLALSPTASLLASIHHTDQPLAMDSGGLTAAEVASDPTQAREQNLLFDAGESLQQDRVGLVYESYLGSGRDLQARIYNTARDFDNRLPFEEGGIVELTRDFYGAGVKYTVRGNLGGRPNRFLVGLDVDQQDDERSRFDNLQGVTGAQTFEQNERVTSLGTFMQNETSLSDAVELTLGMRFDEVEFDVNDRFLEDGDDSGKATFEQISPMAGISFRHGDTHFYSIISSAFETPTTTELANPDGGGFNQSLEAQESVNYEIGMKTHTGRYQFEAALFHIDVNNELTPFELADQPGRSYFENAGSSDRDGLEISYTRQLTERLDLSTAYTYSDFAFKRFTDANDEMFDGNQLPGIPRHLLYVDFSWVGDAGFYVKGDLTYTGELYADNANQTRVDAFSVSNLRVGYNALVDGWEFATFLGLNNIFDEAYNNNIRINAFGERYFEPAPERNAYLGITVRKNFLE